MFSKNKKPDSKIRFQRRTFKQQLRIAREHKRPGNFRADKSKPSKSAAIKTWLPMALAVLAFIYVIYLPNPLDIKTVSISGLNQQQSAQLETLTKQYLLQNKLWPQKNLLLLNKKSLTAFLLAKDPQIAGITQINKHLFHTLKISATARENRFLLTTPEGAFILNSDNSLRVFDSDIASSTLPRIDLLQSGTIKAGGAYPNPEQIAAITFLSQTLLDLAGGPVDYYQLPDTTQSEITVYLKTGSKYLFDYKNNLPDTVNKLRLLLTSIAPQDLKRLSYVDMTINNRGYVCLKATPCAAAQPIIDAATSTASSTLDNLR